MASGPSFYREQQRAKELRAQIRVLPPVEEDTDLQGELPILSEREKFEERVRAIELREQFRVVERPSTEKPLASSQQPLRAKGFDVTEERQQSARVEQFSDLDSRVNFRLGVRCAVRADVQENAYFEVLDAKTDEVRKSWILGRVRVLTPQTDIFSIGDWDVTSTIRKGKISLEFRQAPPQGTRFPLLHSLFSIFKKPERISFDYDLVKEGIRAKFHTSEEWKTAG